MIKAGCYRLAVLGLAVLASVLLPVTPAYADLVFDSSIQVSGTGLGAVNTLVTVLDQGAQGNGIESGCITQGGAFSPCQFGVQGGDNQAQNAVLTFQNNMSFAAVVNINETGQDLSVTLTNLYLNFVGPNGMHNAVYLGAPMVLTQGTGTGLGQSGFVFRLNDAQAAIVGGLGATVSIAGGVQFAEGTTGAGPDTVHVIQIPGPTQQVPEPTSLLLLGAGLIGFAFVRRRRNL